MMSSFLLMCSPSCNTIRNSCLKEVFEILSEVFSLVLLWERLFSQGRCHLVILTVLFCLGVTAVQSWTGTSLSLGSFLLWPLNLRTCSCAWDSKTDSLSKEEQGRKSRIFLSPKKLVWDRILKIELNFQCLTTPGNSFYPLSGVTKLSIMSVKMF